ncbi:MAG: ATP-binding protein [Holosporaceae bacterium]|jgi:anti-sigma regulatory factor (Ser/Thr protein kinase)|nr:ATP-binding protein [Holosporaceae bacterium]
MQFNIKNDINEVSRICDEVQAFCEKEGVSEEKYHDLALILDEMITNVINYAYPDGGEHTFILKIEKINDRINISLVDNGVPFDPLSLGDPDTESSIEERQIGGLGIFIVKQLSEIVEYSRIDDKNNLDIKVSIHNKEGE